MKTTLTIMLVIHILCGFSALITGFISMINRKGLKNHRLTGKIFFVSMTGIFITSVFISIAKDLAFLLMVGFFSYYLACSGYRILYLKKLHLKQKPSLLDWSIAVIGILAGLSLILFSIIWFRDRGPWGFVPLAFGSFCLLNGIMEARSFFTPPANKQHWIRKHGARMGGSFAATLTAFVVVNFEIGSYTWILWILPGMLTAIWIFKAINNYLSPPVIKR